MKIRWMKQPEAGDYPAALEYLSLLYDVNTAAAYVRRLRHAKLCHFKAKDIFRASGLPLLSVSDRHVKTDLAKVKKRHKLAPLLMVRDPAGGKVVIADGYHRLCAVYSWDEDAVISCQII